MVSETENLSQEELNAFVLILVLVEDGLGGTYWPTFVGYAKVLILVLVEDGLGGRVGSQLHHRKQVLILVLVEDGLGGQPENPGG